MVSEGEIREALKQVYDPEIPINVVDLGLIYEVAFPEEGAVAVTMSLTSPMCPVGDELKAQVRDVIARLDGVTSIEVELTFDPVWTPDKMTEDGKMLAASMGLG